MMKSFLSTGVYRPPVNGKGGGIAKMLILFVCLLLTTFTASASVQGIQMSGTGTAADPYQISSVDDWKEFARIVYEGDSTACAVLTQDLGKVVIRVFYSSQNKEIYYSDRDNTTSYGTTTPLVVGTSDHPYCGTFDGQGHTLTLDIRSNHRDVDYIAPFSVVSGATIKNLFTAGTIIHGGDYAGGIIGRIGYSPATLTGCGSSATLQFTFTTDVGYRYRAFTGGLVGCGVVKMTNCIFNGSMTGKLVNRRGGLIGSANAGTTLTNCLQIGSVEMDESDGRYAQSATLAFGTATITNCYYKTAIVTAQGTQVTDEQLASGEIAYKLQNGAAEMAWGLVNGFSQAHH